MESILGRIEDFQTQLGNLHETVSRQIVRFFTKLIIESVFS